MQSRAGHWEVTALLLDAWAHVGASLKLPDSYFLIGKSRIMIAVTPIRLTWGL